MPTDCDVIKEIKDFTLVIVKWRLHVKSWCNHKSSFSQWKRRTSKKCRRNKATICFPVSLKVFLYDNAFLDVTFWRQIGEIYFVVTSRWKRITGHFILSFIQACDSSDYIRNSPYRYQDWLGAHYSSQGWLGVPFYGQSWQRGWPLNYIYLYSSMGPPKPNHMPVYIWTFFNK